ncbi:hypothetical protein PF050_10190 [Kosakonia pseudosacchari]|uniref:hypothetical protein n=1 Tax=Kosakonia pseudosacchari TaxID=1646340 RepID=UPI0022F11FD2|nr:hypothetical protein [Kosakonia pseudosacchari]WBU51255.1 hypothetical protein PF050_10190 [Kosakonia pseudosacchari]
MSYLSYIMPKLAWFIPLCILLFVGYVVYKNRQRDAQDAYIKEHGVSLEAEISDVVYDKIQRINNYFVVVATVKYNYNGKNITSKRGLSFLVTDKEKIKPGKIIKIRISRDMPERFYYEEYQNY